MGAMPRAKHIPQRTCLACRQVRSKGELVRLVRTPWGVVEIDVTGKEAGRGAYLCREQGCWQVAFEKGRLGHALRMGLSPKDRERLLEQGIRLALAGEKPASP